ncbi:MAG: hypothetical protein V3T49_04715 [Dehalococcoidia bacterium]
MGSSGAAIGGALMALASAIARGWATMPTTIPEMTLVRISAKGMKLVGLVGISAEAVLGADGLVIQMFVRNPREIGCPCSFQT